MVILRYTGSVCVIYFCMTVYVFDCIISIYARKTSASDSMARVPAARGNFQPFWYYHTEDTMYQTERPEGRTWNLG